MLNKTIEVKFKIALQSLTIIQKMDTYCWKGWRPNKKEKISKSYKKEKIKSADSQFIISARIKTYSFSQNP